MFGMPAYADEVGVLRYSGAQHGAAHFASADCSFIGDKLQTLMAPHQSDSASRDSGPYLAYTEGAIIFQLDQAHVTAENQFMHLGTGQGVSSARSNGHWTVTFHDAKLVNADFAHQKTLVLNGSLRCGDTVSMKRSADQSGQRDADSRPVSKVHFGVLSESAWTTLANAGGIVIDGSSHAEPSIQVVFDPNNPYDARVYRRMRSDYPGIPVRWVPVAYMRADSAAMAGAMLSSSDPAASLDQDLGQYDEQAKHGGYRLPAGRQWTLPPANQTLFQAWKGWGGYTPMFILRSRDGRILKTGGARAEVLRSVIAHARKAGASDAAATPSLSDRLEFKAEQLCQSTPRGIRRTGCIHAYRQELAAGSGKLRLSDAQMATAMTTVALQSVLALDATVRYWHGTVKWAWPLAARRAPFQAVSEGLGGTGSRKPPQLMACPGGGTLGLIDNGGGAREMKTQHRLPTVEVGFSDSCRLRAGGPAATAVAPTVRYRTQFSAPDGQGQAAPEPVYLLFNSQPRLDNMPAWIAQGPLGVVRTDGGRIKVYADTPEENDSGLSFVFWPERAHHVEHRPYGGVTLRVDANTPGVTAGDCIDAGHRCLLLDTDVGAPDRILAHYRLNGSLDAAPQPVPLGLMPFLMTVDTKTALAFSNEGRSMAWQRGVLSLRSRHVSGQGNPAVDDWRITARPGQSEGRAVVHIAWTRGSGSQARSGAVDVPQARLVSMPHYCTQGETGWACVAPAYSPDWDEN